MNTALRFSFPKPANFHDSPKKDLPMKNEVDNIYARVEETLKKFISENKKDTLIGKIKLFLSLKDEENLIGKASPGKKFRGWRPFLKSFTILPLLFHTLPKMDMRKSRINFILNDSNDVAEILYQILTMSMGYSDKNSFKYYLVRSLTQIEASTDDDARQIVTAAIHYLKTHLPERSNSIEMTMIPTSSSPPSTQT